MSTKLGTLATDTFYGINYEYVAAFDNRRDRFTLRVNRLAGDTDWCIHVSIFDGVDDIPEVRREARAAAKANGYAHFVRHLRVDMRAAAIEAGMDWPEAINYAHEVFPGFSRNA